MAEQQTWLAHEVTPSGIEVRFGVDPKRLYQVRKSAKAHWKDAPSVTTVLDCLAKGGLTWWGMGVGIQGCLELIARGELGRIEGVPICRGDDGFVQADAPAVTALLTEHKLTTNDVRDAAGDRGKSVHDAFELWSKDPSSLPSPSFFPPEEAGYVQGLVNFLEDVRPEPLSAEVQVGSVKHGFAGRYDLRMRVPADCEVVYHRTPVRGPQTRVLAAGTYLVDLKTSRKAYPSHALQLAAYEEASIECGYEPTDGRGVINVSAEGAYVYKGASATYQDFGAVLGVWKRLQKSKEWL